MIAGLASMGAKYLPTVKDHRASKRFQQKLHVVSKFIKPAGHQVVTKAKKK